jgi:hypothetical protein
VKLVLREIRRSWWLALPVFSVGMLGWGAFLYTGVRVRRRLWIAFGLFYLAVVVAAFVLFEVDPADDDRFEGWGGGLLALTWFVTSVHAIVIRGAFVERLEVLEDPRIERVERLMREREGALAILRRDPEEARELGVGRPDLKRSFHGGLIDVNHVDARWIAKLPGFDEALAKRVVEVREEIDGFSSIEDLGHCLDLPADLVDGIRERAVVIPRR